MADTAGKGLIDSHAHVWDRTCQMVPGARYHPGYEATTNTYLGVLDAHGIERAVLVQPSFLGTDNRYLLDSLRAHPDRLRGIVVLDPSASDAQIDDMTALGVIGHRYNLLSMDPGLLATQPYADLTERATKAGWWTEIQAHGRDWGTVQRSLGRAKIMVDHFGKPSDRACPGIRSLLANRPDQDRLCVKLSAPYRQSISDLDQHREWIMQVLDAKQFLWGSDWPWTQHEGRHSYQDCIDWFSLWTTDRHRSAIHVHAPRLLGFDA